jgi:hypothetical protein
MEIEKEKHKKLHGSAVSLLHPQVKALEATSFICLVDCVQGSNYRALQVI